MKTQDTLHNRSRTKLATALCVAAAMSATVLGTLSPATASPAAPPAAAGIQVHATDGGLAAYTPTHPHCVVSLPGMAQRCFVNFTMAISYATRGRVTNAPADGRAARTDRAFLAAMDMAARQAPSQSVSVAIPTVIATLHWDIKYGGATWTVEGDAGPCDNDGAGTWDYRFGYIGDHWNDQLSSFHGYGNCDQRNYEHAGPSGAVLSLRTLDDDLTNDWLRPGVTWNDQVSAIEWT